MHAIQATKKEVNVKTEEILHALPRNSKGDTWASIAAAAAPKTTVPATPRPQSVEQKSAEAIRRSKDIIVKLNDPDTIKEYRDKTPITILGKVNSALATCGHSQIQTCRALAAKQLRSGDICISFASDAQAMNLRNQQSQWTAALSPKATVNRQTYGVLVHGVHTETFNLQDPETIGKIIRQNTNIHGLEISRLTWLNGAKAKKTEASVIMEITDPLMANIAIDEGIFWNAEHLAVERYDLACHLHQCFKCQAYSHIEPQCYSREKCS